MVVAEVNRGWILDGICRDMLPHLGGRGALAYVDTRRRRWKLPAAQTYFFTHFSLYADARRRRLLPPGARTLVFYTHPRETGLSRTELVGALSQCTQVLSMASMHGRQLEQWGVPPERITTVLGAADPAMFRGHERTGRGAVGVVSAYYERKSPDRVVEVVRALDGREVLLVGRNWTQYAGYGDLVALPHLRHVEAPYDQYPSLYAAMDVFLSVSTLEGGPIPLIEAMMSNVVPVATRTGFAPDVITDGHNGFLLDVEASAEQVVDRVDAAFQLRRDVRADALHLDWERYAGFVLAHL
jgi:glycosyltransferase involved in cell wall biosynthesis